jgi:hypothetical protein
MELPKGGFDIPAALKITRPRIPLFLITSETDVYTEKDALAQGAVLSSCGKSHQIGTEKRAYVH